MVRRRGILVSMVGAAFALLPGVLGAQVREVQVSPPSVSLTVGQQQSMFATAYDGSGNVVPTAQFTWRSTNTNIVRVEPDNSAPGVAVVIAVGPGTVQVEARSGNARGQATIIVGGGGGAAAPQVGTGAAAVVRIEPQNIHLLPSEQRQLIPIFLRDDGQPAAPQRVTWQSFNPSVVTVSDAGLVLAVSEGQAAIQVTTPTGLQAVSPVSVSASDLAFEVPILSLSPGEERTVTVTVPAQENRAISNQALSWQSTNQGVVTVTPLGVVRAVGPGSAQIVASGFLRTQVLPVRVHRPVSTMELVPGPSAGPVVVPMQGSIAFEARSLAADGTPVPEAPMLWRVEDTTIARFDTATKRLHGLALGTTSLRLRGPGPDVLEASWEVQVVAGGLMVEPEVIGLRVRDTTVLRARFTNTDGRPIAAASGHEWTSTNPEVVQVTSSGVVTGTGRGSASIIAATPWGAADTAQVIVQGELLFAANRGGSVNIWAIDRATPANATQVTDDPAAEVAPAYAPDGARIAFISTRDGNPELYVALADGSNARRLTNTPGGEDAPVWSPDGQRIYYTAAAPRARAQVWVINADGTGARALTTDTTATNFQPAVSPDGQTIAFTSTRDGNYEIYLMDADGSNQRNVTESPGKESVPQWFSADQLAYLAETRAGAGLQSQVVRRQLSSGQQAPLSPAGLMVTDFSVSKDGQWLAMQVDRFSADGGISRRVFLFPLTGGGPVEIPTASADEQQSSPSWR